MSIANINVKSAAGRYTVAIGDGLVGGLGSLFPKAVLRGRIFVVSNPLVWRLYGRSLSAGLEDVEPILVPDGERFKQLSTVARVYEALIRRGADRSSVLVALGGGVIGDLAGFAAATYLRGVPLVQIPTTLLAQVDAAIGGKVGVNHALGKNLIGAFYSPRIVIIDPAVLGSLPKRDFRAGLYEVVKYGVIRSRRLFDRLERDLPAVVAREPRVLRPVIRECCSLKASIVSSDERESGLRRVLNFGHTAGHALETITNYRRFRHGEAVAHGMMVAARISASRGVMHARDHERLCVLIRRLGRLPPVSDLSAREVIQVVRHDKKMLRGRLHFVLSTGIGRTTIVDDVGDRELGAALRDVGLAR